MTRLRETFVGFEFYLHRDRDTGALHQSEPAEIYGKVDEAGFELAKYAANDKRVEYLVLVAAAWLKYFNNEIDEAERDYELEFLSAEYSHE